MTFITVCCPYCESEQIVNHGKTHSDAQHSLYRNTAFARGSFLRDDHNRGWRPEVELPSIDISLKASGVCDAARVLRFSVGPVLPGLRKQARVLESVNTVLLRLLNPNDIGPH
jgi:hypothetical protein